MYRGIYLPRVAAFTLPPLVAEGTSPAKCDEVICAVFPLIVDFAVEEKLDVA